MKSLDAYLDHIQQGITSGPFGANWPSLEHYQVPDWYQDAKFGIFIHWGVYSVPAFGNEWYPRHMYVQGTAEFEHHLATYGSQSQFGYKDFIPDFRAERYEPAAWAELFRDAGARFVVPVAEHHDGFAMYECGFSRWKATAMGPKRDTIGELAAATRAAGMVFGLSSHRAEHFWFFDGGRAFDSDVQDPAYADLYGPARPAPRDSHNRCDAPPDADFLDDWLARTCELVDLYRPQIVWFDWWINNLAFAPYLQKFAAYYYNRAAEWGEGVAINYKYEAYPEAAAVFDVERGQLAGIRERFWQTDTSISKNSWGYTEGQDYKTAGAVIADLVDIVSKNGALLLNIGPRPDGTIPEPEQEVLREIGRWLALNGEAVYTTRPFTTCGEGPTQVVEGAFTDTKRGDYTSRDLRYTRKGDTVYAITLAPAAGPLPLLALAEGSPHYPGKIGKVEVVGSDAPVTWERNAAGLVVDLSAVPPTEHGIALRITPA